MVFIWLLEYYIGSTECTVRLIIFYFSCIFMVVIYCRLLNPDGAILGILGKVLRFELTVGMNGRTWVNSSKIEHTILIVNAIEQSEYMTLSQIKQNVHRLAEGMRE